jgi:hypothetical protein
LNATSAGGTSEAERFGRPQSAMPVIGIVSRVVGGKLLARPAGLPQIKIVVSM